MMFVNMLLDLVMLSRHLHLLCKLQGLLPEGLH